jgi:DNA-binding transcriptional MerR regulator
MSVRLSIGDFSRMTHLSIKALRHYHDVGLLPPAEIDSQSGYRYYEPDQVAKAQVIRRFRDLDMPVDEIKAVLTAPDPSSRNELIMTHLERMQAQLKETEATVTSLRSLLDPDSASLAIEYRSVPETPALAVAETVNAEDAWAISTTRRPGSPLRPPAAQARSFPLSSTKSRKQTWSFLFPWPRHRPKGRVGQSPSPCRQPSWRSQHTVALSTTSTAPMALSGSTWPNGPLA